MLCLAATMAWVLYRAGEEATDAVSQKAMDALMSRTRAIVERHLASAHVVVDAIAPMAVPLASPAPAIEFDLPQNLEAIEDRLWIATGLYPDVNNIAYFGGQDGRFVSVRRLSADGRVEARYRLADAGQSNVYSMAGPHQQVALLQTDQFDPRARPWYAAAVQRGKPAWSPVYVDFSLKLPMLTLSKPIYARDRSLLGVVGTDISLRQLSQLLQNPVSHGGVQFIVDASGDLIATSSGELPFARVDDASLKRQSASENASPLVRAGYQFLKKELASQLTPGVPLLRQIDSEQGKLQVAAMLMRDDAGLDWTSIAVVPRSALRTEISGVTLASLGLGLLLVLLTLWLAYATLRGTLRDIRKLTRAVRDVSFGEPLADIKLQRNDEIAALAESFQEMERSLRTDGLTHLLNRDAFVSQVELRRRRSSDMVDMHFALVFINLDNFREVNSRYGHSVGDKVLMEIGIRLRNAVRKDDSAARYGGDEFVVYLHGVKTSGALEQLCDKLKLVLELPVDLGRDDTAQVNISIGAALYPDDGLDMQSLLAVCDSRMLQEKQQRQKRDATTSD